MCVFLMTFCVLDDLKKIRMELEVPICILHETRTLHFNVSLLLRLQGRVQKKDSLHTTSFV